jgi:acyl-CoA thioester hydrolase
MSLVFEHVVVAGWGDTDFNGHMRNTAFLDKAADTRMLFFAQQGFTIEQFQHHRIGPVIMRDEVEYFREVRMMDSVRIRLLSAGLAPDGSRFRIRNEYWREDGQLAARVTSTGGWLDLGVRRLVIPPDTLVTAMRALERTDDFAELPGSVK